MSPSCRVDPHYRQPRRTPPFVPAQNWAAGAARKLLVPHFHVACGSEWTSTLCESTERAKRMNNIELVNGVTLCV